MSSHDMLLSTGEGIRRIPIGEGSDKVDITIQRIAKKEDTGRVIGPSSPETVWSADCKSLWDSCLLIFSVWLC
jgi:hypothetical protein